MTDMDFSNLGLKCYFWHLYGCGQQQSADVQFSNLGRATNRDNRFSLGKRRSLFSDAILTGTKMDRFIILFLVVVLAIVVVVVGQKPARIGDDGKPLLNRSYIQRPK